MRNLMKAGLVWTGILLSLPAWGQIRETVPLGVLPMQYIGSFAGEAGAPRLNLNGQYSYRKSFAGFGPQGMNFFRDQTYDFSMSYDQFIPAIRSGVGLTAAVSTRLSDANSFSYFHSRGDTRYLALSVAPKISIKGKYTLSPSVDLIYAGSSYDTGDSGGTSERRGEGFGSRIGVLWNTSKYYIGYSFSGINSFRLDGEKIPYRFESALQVGYTFQKSADSHFSFTPQLALHLRHTYTELSVYRSNVGRVLGGFNLNFRYKKFIWGLNNTGIHLGIQNDRLRLMLTNYPGFWGSNKYYVGNLSFRYVFKEKSR